MLKSDAADFEDFSEKDIRRKVRRKTRVSSETLTVQCDMSIKIEEDTTICTDDEQNASRSADFDVGNMTLPNDSEFNGFKNSADMP